MMKYILIFALIFAVSFSQSICPATLLNKCEAEAQKAFQYCDQAAKEKGQDQQADLNCMKWALSAEKDCWPCICQMAKNQGWKIKGCDTIMEIIEIVQNLRNQKH